MRISGRIFQTTHRLFQFGDCLVKIILPLQLRIHGIFYKIIH